MKENGSSRKQGAPSPCAACKLLRRRCAQDCVFAPYFPADEPRKFANVHKVFGASNVNKMLQELPEHQRGDAVSSMVYEANARVRDPVYGCVGAISSLQQQIDVLQTQLAVAQAEVVHLRVRQTASFSNNGLSPSNSGSPPSKFMGSQARPILDMDMMVDHTSLGLGVLEQDVSSEVSIQKNIHITWYWIIGWIVNGVVASLVIFLANIYTFSPNSFQKNGQVADITHLGAMTYTCIIWTVNCQIALIMNRFTWIQHLFIWGSILIWYVFLLVYGAFPHAYSQRGFRVLIEVLGPAPLYWTVTLFVVVVSLLPYFIHMVIQRSFYPLDDHVIQEMKHCRKDVAVKQVWERERSNSIKMTPVGVSAWVDARIRVLKEQLHHKKQLIYRSVTSSPIFRSLTHSPA